MVATRADAGTPDLAILADAAAKFVARNTPSWTKIHASNRRLASKTTFSSVLFCVPGDLSILYSRGLSSKKEAGDHSPALVFICLPIWRRLPSEDLRALRSRQGRVLPGRQAVPWPFRCCQFRRRARQGTRGQLY